MSISTINKNSERILVVDDEELNLEIIRDFLEDTDYELIEAKDGFEAWSILENYPNNIDLVLLDRMLPGLDGMQVLSKIKTHTVLKHIPVILQTAKVGKQDVLEGMQAGAFYYLTKPYEEEILKSVIKTALGERQFYLGLQQNLKKTTGTLSLMKSGSFEFSNLKEAQDLALFISNACPSPEGALTGLSELMINAIEHGNLGISYKDKTRLLNEEKWESEIQQRLAAPEHADKFATLDFHHGEDAIKITVEDMGAGFNWHEYLEITIERASDNHGRGIAMAKILSFDNIEYFGKGNKVTASISLNKASSISRKAQVQLETA